MEVTLQILHGRLKSGTSAPKVEGFTIRQPQFVIGGDAACNMVCRSRLVGPRHCQITLSDHEVTLEDLGSEHGTFINGQRVGGKSILKTGDVLKVGRLEFHVLVHAPPASQLPEPRRLPNTPPVARDTVAMSASASDTVVDKPPVKPADGTESVDDLVSQLLEEADEKDRELRRRDPATRYLKVETASPSDETQEASASEEAGERPQRPQRKRPIKLPTEKLGKTSSITGKDSVNAAELALDELLRSPKK